MPRTPWAPAAFLIVSGVALLGYVLFQATKLPKEPRERIFAILFLISLNPLFWARRGRIEALTGETIPFAATASDPDGGELDDESSLGTNCFAFAGETGVVDERDPRPCPRRP